MCLSTDVRPEKNSILSLHFNKFNRPFDGLIGVLLLLCHLDMIYSFNYINLAKKTYKFYHCFAGRNNLNVVSTSLSKSKQTWFPWCLMPIGTIQHPEHTKYRTCQQQCTGSKCSLFGIKMTITTKPVEFIFSSPVYLLVLLNAEVLVVVVVVGCVKGSWPLAAATHTASLWHKMPERGYQDNFQESVLSYRLSMFCQSCVTCPSIRTDPEIPPPGYEAQPRTRV